MLRFQSNQTKIIGIIGIIIIIVLSTLAFKGDIFGMGKRDSIEKISPEDDSYADKDMKGAEILPGDEHDNQVPEFIKIYIAGQVKKPGVIEVPVDCRLVDAVELAGGFLVDANLLGINLALRVEDENMYVIPKIGEEAPETGSLTFSEKEAKINISTADQSQLESLPRIGPVLAGNIIKYREDNGPFKREEDLMNVSGIGQKTFDGLKDLITVR